MQSRTGPNTVGILGVLQPIGDAIKLMGKELILPSRANSLLFTSAPILALFLALLPWLVLPLQGETLSGNITGVVPLNYGLLFLFAISGLAVYPVLIAGWSSNSIYPFLGALRATATMVSYELVIGVIQLATITLAGSLSFKSIMAAQEHCWGLFPLWPLFIMLIVSSLAECSRPPFDLTEGESELVGGFATEYGAMSFSLIALTEYTHIISTSLFIATAFIGGSAWIPLWFKYMAGNLLFVWVRAAVPRYRLDTLQYLNWKGYILISLGALLWAWGLIISGFAYLG